MVNRYFVYSLIFSRTPEKAYRFLCFQKRAKGYYFSGKGAGGGTIVPDGQQLKGAAKFALPGGQFDGKDWTNLPDVLAQCQKELTEECGRQIHFVTNTQIVAAGGVSGEDETVHAVATLKQWGVNLGSTKGYAALYLQVPDKELEVIAGYIGTCMQQRDDAALKITNGEWGAGDYGKLAAAFPMAPMDDEIHPMSPTCYVIAVDGFAKDPFIAALLNDSDTDWFGTIIAALPDVSN